MPETYIPIACPHCAGMLRVRPEYIGHRLRCRNCQSDFDLPHYSERSCPDCGDRLRFRTEYMGRQVVCRHCNASFQADPRDRKSDDRLSNASGTLGATTAVGDSALVRLHQPTSEPAGPDHPSEVDEPNRASAEIEALAGALDDARHRLELAESQHVATRNDLQIALEKQDDARRQTESVRAELDGVRAEVARLHQALEEVQDQVQQAEAERDSTRAELEAARTLQAELEHRLREAVTDRDQQVGLLHETRATLEERRRESEETDTRLQGLATVLTTTTSERNEAQERESRAAAEIAALGLTITQHRAEIDMLRESLAEAQQAVRDGDRRFEKQWTELVTERDALREQLQSQFDQDLLRDDLDEPFDREAADRERDQLIAERDALRRDVEAARADLATTGDHLQRAEHERDLTNQQLIQMRTDLTEVENRLRDAVREHAETLDSQRDLAQQQLSQAQEQRDEVETSLRSVTERLQRRLEEGRLRDQQLRESVDHLEATLERERAEHQIEREAAEQARAALSHALEAAHAEILNQPRPASGSIEGSADLEIARARISDLEHQLRNSQEVRQSLRENLLGLGIHPTDGF